MTKKDLLLLLGCRGNFYADRIIVIIIIIFTLQADFTHNNVTRRSLSSISVYLSAPAVK